MKVTSAARSLVARAMLRRAALGVPTASSRPEEAVRTKRHRPSIGTKMNPVIDPFAEGPGHAGDGVTFPPGGQGWAPGVLLMKC